MVKVTGCGQFGVLLTKKGINADWEPMPTLMVVRLNGIVVQARVVTWQVTVILKET
jgi:hypothetical protein